MGQSLYFTWYSGRGQDRWDMEWLSIVLEQCHYPTWYGGMGGVCMYSVHGSPWNSLQWNLLIRDTFVQTALSLIRRLSFIERFL